MQPGAISPEEAQLCLYQMVSPQAEIPVSLTSSHSVLGTVFPAIGMQNSCPTQFIRGLGAPGDFIVLKDWLPMSTRTDLVTDGSPEGLLLYYLELGLGDPDERTGGWSYHNRQ